MSSIRDYRKIINVQDATDGQILDVVDYEKFLDRNITTTMTLGELLILRRVKDILTNEHDVILKFGYKS